MRWPEYEYNFILISQTYVSKQDLYKELSGN